MQELIQKLQDEHGITSEQSHGIINTIADFIKQKVPMVGGMIDQYLHSGSADTQTNSTDHTAIAPNANEGTLDKLEDLVKGKLGGMFGS